MVRGVPDRPCGEAQARLDSHRLALSRARAALARGRLEQADRSLAEAMRAADPLVVMRAKIQLALVEHNRGRADRVAELLTGVGVDVSALCKEHRERGQSARQPAAVTGAGRQASIEGLRDLQMELARVSSTVGRSEDAKNIYRALLQEASPADPRSADESHLVALAQFRLAELLIDDHPTEAYERLKRALDARDERVSPYAALRMATAIDEQLVQGRIEWLFRIAMGSNDPELFCEAALGMARHLRARRQFGAARRYLEMVLGIGGDAHVADARAELRSIDQFERIAPIYARFTRLRQLRARLYSEVERHRTGGRRVLIVGAGTGGVYLLESLAGQDYTICGFVDDNATEVPGYPQHRVLGGIEQLARIIDDCKPSQVLLAIPTLPGSRRKAVVQACRDKATQLLSLPRMHDLGIGWKLEDSRRRLMAQLRAVDIVETIGDHRIEIDSRATSWLQYQTALVVGGGALGAEICRRLADGEVGRLIVIDRRESALRKIQNDLLDTRGFWCIELLEGAASDYGYLRRIFRESTPSAVFNTTGHASALSFEPSQLGRGLDAWASVLRGEILSASAVALAAADVKVPRTIHISSRRAGIPGDPFGAVKALVEEMIFLHGCSYPGMVQAVVRVGALLDSRNGRLARLKQQIRTGTRVTIPARDATVRFLPTARWAELVLHAAQRASDSELFEPDAGDEVLVRDIAEEAIRLEGWYPGEHVVIEEVRDDQWDDPPSVGARRADGDDLGIYSLERSPASEESVALAAVACAASIGRYESDFADCHQTISAILRDVERIIGERV